MEISVYHTSEYIIECSMKEGEVACNSGGKIEKSKRFSCKTKHCKVLGGLAGAPVEASFQQILEQVSSDRRAFCPYRECDNEEVGDVCFPVGRRDLVLVDKDDFEYKLA
eukprot:scaffold41_cov90-Cyclotella_meneghiniana.AAC.2